MKWLRDRRRRVVASMGACAIAACAIGALVMPLAGHAATRLAAGVIVKLRDAGDGPAPVLDVRQTGPSAWKPRLRDVMAGANLPGSYRVRATAFGSHVLRSPGPTSFAAAAAHASRLRRDPRVAWAIVDEIEQPHAATTIPDDPGYAQQQWLADGATGALPNIPAAWDRLAALGRGLSPVVVAVLDTGVLRHPELAGRVLFDEGYDFVSEAAYSNDGDGVDADATDPGSYLQDSTKTGSPSVYADCKAANSSWHGTVIAGQLAATANNQRGVAGMLLPLDGPLVLPVRVSGNCGAAVSDILEGILWSAGVSYTGIPKANSRPARVLNLSFGSSESCSCTYDSAGQPTSAGCLYQEAIRAVTRRGALLVASSGNAEGTADGQATPSRPANCPGVLGVTALRADGAKAKYAFQVGPQGIATVGGSGDATDEGIFSTSNGGTTSPARSASGDPEEHYAALDGTSFSAPIVSGTAALMWAVNPGLSVAELLNGLRTQGVRTHAPVSEAGVALPACTGLISGACNCTAASCGAGILDVDKAVQWAAAQSQKSYVPVTVQADFFTPERAQTPPTPRGSHTDGGGGAVGWMEMAALAALLAAARLVSARQTRRAESAA